jgi:xanthine/CO dehydrogenase XdhC/CoxF family maturation factor
MNATELLKFFETRRERGEPMVLGAVIETQGSTYSKAGAFMLVDRNGVFRGMLSGGCLEGDIAARAEAVLETRQAQLVTYDLGREDELWGMGVGCDGLMQVVLLPLRPDEGYEPFATMASIIRGRGAGNVTIAVPGDPPGQADLRLEPPPRVLILGAGPDAEPVVRFAAELGWRCTVSDHRPAYVANGDFAGAEKTLCVPAAELADSVELATYDMAIVMSHHLDSDRSYLRQLAAVELRYVGLLGPAHRRRRLLGELGEAAGDLADRLRGPAGLDLGGRGPGPIALSIVAEMQRSLATTA